MKRDIAELAYEVRRLRNAVEDLERNQRYMSTYRRDFDPFNRGAGTLGARTCPREGTGISGCGCNRSAFWEIVAETKWETAYAAVTVLTMIAVLAFLMLRR